MMTFRKIRSFHILSLLSGWGILTIAMTLLFYCGYWGEASFILLLWIYLLFLLLNSFIFSIVIICDNKGKGLSLQTGYHI